MRNFAELLTELTTYKHYHKRFFQKEEINNLYYTMSKTQTNCAAASCNTSKTTGKTKETSELSHAELKAEIRRLAEEKNAVIMAHYYVDGEVQDIADFIGDSLALAQQAAKTDADIIVLCGVHFMGETNKIL